MKEFDGFSKKRIKIQRFVVIFKLYVIISMAVAFISGAYLLTTFMPDKLTNKQTLLVLITSISISIASVSAIIIAFINARSQLQRENKSFENKLIFLELFKVFERNSKDILFKKNAKYNSLSYRSLINELFERNLIDSDDVAMLDNIIKIRNSIVHAEPEIIDNSSYAVDVACGQLKYILKKISY